jgi:CheY-like chemotaxis protein
MPLKILIVDEPENLKVMRSLTNALGHYVQTFNDARKAGEWAQTHRIDVAIVGMLQGFDLVQAIRSATPNHETAIIMLDATDNIDHSRKAFGEGVDFVLTKAVSRVGLRPLLMAMEAPDWKSKRRTARLPIFTDVICRWDDQHFPLRSINISESGILLQPAVDIAMGQEVELEFKIGEPPVTLDVLARIVRKEGNERVGMAFVGLAPEEQNAVQLYILGRLKNQTKRSDHLSDIGMRRSYRP